MKSRLLGIAVVLVALAVIINALALQSADITNKITVTVAGNASSLVGIVEATGTGQDNDVNVADVDNQAVITFPKGLQAASTYEFDAAFAVVNRSADSVNVTLPAPITDATTGVTLTFAPSSDASHNTTSGLATNGELWVKLTVSVPEGVTTTGDLSPINFVIAVDRTP